MSGVAGRLRCPRCGKAMVGTIATGRTKTYRYYTCHTRNRYDSTSCDAPRLDAESADAAVLTAMVDFYRDHHTLIAEAVTAAQHAHRAARTDRRSELTAVEADLATVRRALDRDLAAYEHGAIEKVELAESSISSRTPRTRPGS